MKIERNGDGSIFRKMGTVLFFKASRIVRKNRTVPIYLSVFLSFYLGIVPPMIKAEEIPSQSEEKISLDLKDVGIVELLRIISLKTGKTIVPSKEVTGRITIYLNNVTFKDVLDIILLSQGLACEKKGEIVYIMSNAEYKRLYGKDYIEPRKLKSIKLTYAKPANVFNALSQVKSDIGKIIADEASGTIILIDIPEKLVVLEKTAKELDQPLPTAIFDLNYAKASDAKTQISAAITPGTGEVIVDERSAKAIISDLPKKMEKLGRIVKELDEETRQVFIEADIVEVNLSNKFQRGIDWEKIFNDKHLDGLDLVGYFPLTLAAYQKLSVGKLTRDNYNSVLNFLETYGDVKTLSQPRIAVVNKEEANIMVGTRDAYITQTLSQAETTTVTSESVEFIDVGVKLKVVPTISKDGFITMKIKPEVSSVKETITTALGSRIPIVQTSEAETVVKVKDGTMIMIAGLIKEEKKDEVSGVPGLARIPLLGILFSKREKENKKTELIVFITPTLTKGEVALEGTEAQKNIPPELMPEKIKQKVIREQTISQSLDEFEKGIRPMLKAKPEVKKPMKESPLFGQAKEYYRQGLASQNSGNYSEAITYYQKAAILAPQFAPAYNQLGILFEAQGLLNKAEEMYIKAITVGPNYLAAYSNLALLSEAKNNPSQAIEYWRKRVELGEESDPWTQTALKHLRELEKGD